VLGWSGGDDGVRGVRVGVAAALRVWGVVEKARRTARGTRGRRWWQVRQIMVVVVLVVVVVVVRCRVGAVAGSGRGNFYRGWEGSEAQFWGWSGSAIETGFTGELGKSRRDGMGESVMIYKRGFIVFMTSRRRPASWGLFGRTCAHLASSRALDKRCQAMPSSNRTMPPKSTETPAKRQFVN
jgi:hypothetical protein